MCNCYAILTENIERIALYNKTENETINTGTFQYYAFLTDGTKSVKLQNQTGYATKSQKKKYWKRTQWAITLLGGLPSTQTIIKQVNTMWNKYQDKVRKITDEDPVTTESNDEDRAHIFTGYF